VVIQAWNFDLHGPANPGACDVEVVGIATKLLVDMTMNVRKERSLAQELSNRRAANASAKTNI
jgi:hypothetical protein